MKVSYDRMARIGGVGLVPWARLGPERWFDNYKIASLYGWDIRHVGRPKVHPIASSVDAKIGMSRLNVYELIRTRQFQDVLREHFLHYKMLTYKPVAIPDELKKEPIQFLSSNQEIAPQLENKALFRREFSEYGVIFPDYHISTVDRLHQEDGLAYALDGRDEVVLQDAILSGGKGTFFVRDESSLQHALDSLASMGAGQEIVLSSRVTGSRERTVQAVVTRYGVFVGPLQKQIVGDALLANMNIPDGDKFCGAEIGGVDICADSYDEMKRIALKIGKILQDKGYRGIFGMDCLVAGDGSVYVLEINPRITGVTPLLTALYRQVIDIPFYLLHILELSEAEYSLDESAHAVMAEAGSLLIVHAQNTTTARVAKSLRSGIYTRDLKYVKESIDYHELQEGQVLVQQYTPPNFNIKPGGRLVSVLVKGPVMDEDDALLPSIRELTVRIQRAIVLEDIVLADTII